MISSISGEVIHLRGDQGAGSIVLQMRGIRGGDSTNNPMTKDHHSTDPLLMVHHVGLIDHLLTMREEGLIDPPIMLKGVGLIDLLLETKVVGLRDILVMVMRICLMDPLMVGKEVHPLMVGKGAGLTGLLKTKVADLIMMGKEVDLIDPLVIDKGLGLTDP